MNAFALDQRAGKDGAKDRRPCARLESLYIHAARQIKQFFLWEISRAKRLRCFFGKDDDQTRQFVFFDEALAFEQQASLPFFEPARRRCRSCRGLADFSRRPVAMPGWNLDERRNVFLFCHAQSLQTVARPAVKEIVASRRQMPRGNPIQVFLFGAIIVRTIEKRDETYRVPAERLDETRRNFALSVVVGDRFPRKPP